MNCNTTHYRANSSSVPGDPTGIDALDVIKGGLVDVVLTDMKMPTIGGLELLSEIRRLPLPVATIVMTGFGTVETALRAMKEGAFDYILKPFKLRDVHDAVTRAAERLRVDREVGRMRDLLSFYETAAACVSKHDLLRLYGMVANVALREMDAEEVAVWMEGAAGWEAVARGGAVGALTALDPSGISSERRGESGIIAVPIVSGDARVGVLAVAGGPPRADRDLARLRLLSRVVGEAMDRTRDDVPVAAGMKARVLNDKS